MMARSPKAIRINLLKRNDEGKKSLLIFAITCLLITLTGGWTGYFLRSSHQELMALRETNSELRAALSDYQLEQSWLKSARATQSRLEERRKIMEQIQQLKTSGVAVMEEIEKSMPSNMVMIAIEIKKDKVTMNGYAPQHRDAARLLSGLRQSSLFKDIMLTSSKIDENSNEVAFSVEMGWEAKRN